MVNYVEGKRAGKVLSCAMSVVLAAGLAPVFVAPAQAIADEGNALAAAAIGVQEEAVSTLADGYYSASVDFSCFFEKDGYKHDMSSVLASDKALVHVEDGQPEVAVLFGEGDYVLNGNPLTKVNLADSYTVRRGANAGEVTPVDIAVSEEEAPFGDEAYIEAEYTTVEGGNAIRSITFDASDDVSKYYLQTGVDGGMHFPYTSSEGNVYYATINIDWSSLLPTYGTNKVSFEPNSVYAAKVSLKNANDTTKDSMAGSMLPESATISVASDGTATVTTAIKSVTVGNLIGYASGIKVYTDASKASSIDAKVLSADADGHPILVSFEIPKASRDLDGVYMNMTVDAMGASPDAFMAIDYATAAKLLSVAKPTAATDLVYTGKELTGVKAGTGYTLSGTDKATAAGSYTATAVLSDGYVWADGTNGEAVIDWSIAKAAKPTLTVKTEKKSTTVAKSKKGKLTFAPITKVTTNADSMKYSVVKDSKNSKYLTLNKSNGKITLKKKTPKGTYTIKVKATAQKGSNFKQDASVTKTLTITVKAK